MVPPLADKCPGANGASGPGIGALTPPTPAHPPHHPPPPTPNILGGGGGSKTCVLTLTCYCYATRLGRGLWPRQGRGKVATSMLALWRAGRKCRVREWMYCWGRKKGRGVGKKAIKQEERQIWRGLSGCRGLWGCSSGKPAPAMDTPDIPFWAGWS